MTQKCSLLLVDVSAILAPKARSLVHVLNIDTLIDREPVECPGRRRLHRGRPAVGR